MAFRDFAAVPGFGQRAQHWADALYFGVPGQQGPWPIGTAFGIHGVGLIKRGQRDYIALLAPMKLGVQEVRLDELELTDLASDEETLAAIRTVLPDETADQVRILRIPPMIPNATAGTAVYGTMRGTAGPRVTWSNGHIGFLTAGHVAVGTLQVTRLSRCDPRNDHPGPLAGNNFWRDQSERGCRPDRTSIRRAHDKVCGRGPGHGSLAG